MTEDDQLDLAQWLGYLTGNVVYYSNRTINQMITDLLTEKRNRNYKTTQKEPDEI